MKDPIVEEILRKEIQREQLLHDIAHANKYDFPAKRAPIVHRHPTPARVPATRYHPSVARAELESARQPWNRSGGGAVRNA
ncbi:MAG: hypothetical protein Q8922_05450 [Bacteroidota bacterium]|nr:hypothetical protein [Bacteroidota bacterium]MDP4233152.1 hypothetical protein [Bacteroidota bacterium]MDP4241703.1 hypothetical protein [Bacteroidota bacterium]MDP4287361.1 hypothetical protein [Bacteroidota bacterium]